MTKRHEWQAKAEQTNSQALAAIEAERQHRIAKTAKLREARLAALAALPPVVKTKKKRGFR